MNLSELRLQVAPGDGLVTNLGSVAFVVLAGEGEEQVFVDQLVGVIDGVTAASGADVGRPLIRQLAGLITNTPTQQVMPFGLVADADDALAVMLFGPLDLSVSLADGHRELVSGAEATMWVDRLVHGVIERIAIVPAGTAERPIHHRHDLRLGTVPGSGFALAARQANGGAHAAPDGGRATDAAPATPAAPEPAAPTPAAPEPVVPAETAPVPAESAVPAPAPSGTTSPQPAPPGNEQPVAENTPPAPPADEFVAVLLSGRPTDQRDALPLVGDDDAAGAPVPAAPGRLVLLDGTSITLLGDVVVGRDPRHSPDVVAGTATPLVLADPERAVSRVHAAISTEDGFVTVKDLGSSNGTGIAQAGEEQWTLLTPGEPAILFPGARIRIGAEELSYVVDQPPAAEPEPAAPNDPPSAPLVVSTPRPENPVDGVGDYVFVRPLGRGGRGGYFLAVPPERLQLNAEYVAVKVFTGATSDDAFRRAARELRAVAAAESPYLVKVHDAGQDNGQLFYCMDYFPLGPLDEPAAPLTREGAIRAVAQAARGAHALHEVGVVHQGIKPSNILLGSDHAYLSDLGLAQVIAPGQSVTSLGTMGDLEYLDPSILTGGRGTRATDIWSLAATLHKVLTGVGIFEDLPSGALLAIRTVLTQPPRMSPTLRPDEARVIHACLDEDPAARPVTALALAEQIEALLDDPS